MVLTEEQTKQLEQGYKTSDNHCFRQRCKMLLLKAEGYTAQQIAEVLATNKVSVYNWLKRYETLGIEGLHTKEGQGRKPILEEEHLAIVKAAIEQERQRLSQARVIVEQNTGKKMSDETLSRFLKVITAVTSE